MTTIANGHWHRMEGMRILRSHLAPPLWTVSRATLLNHSIFHTHITSQNSHLWDSQYSLTNLHSWQRIIRELTNTEALRPSYLVNRKDCDNFASILHAKVCELFRLNAFASVLGRVWRTSDGVLVGHHMWNAFYTSNARIWYVEPITDGMVEVTAQDVVIGEWRYRGDVIYWF